MDDGFRVIPGFGGLYRASRSGQILGVKRGRLLKQFRDRRGYLHVNLYDGSGRPKHCLVHRLVFEAWVSPIPSGFQVNHISGKCNQIENLEIVTPEENRDHAMRTGLINRRGEANPRAKLTEDNVREIRKLRAQGMSVQAIAWMFRVSEKAIYCIVMGKTWKHVGADAISQFPPRSERK